MALEAWVGPLGGHDKYPLGYTKQLLLWVMYTVLVTMSLEYPLLSVLVLCPESAS